ncbi:type III secretion effector GogB [Escherichia albertii]|uniref:type III secretion system protein n=1 Tax=Escherichia albertii TaxID=208962 RepID=UPI0013DDB33D|nr:type III secretion system protein [Escherichia albertii]EFF0785340.1 type III secretion system protein [Escherichia albertii]MCZ8807917.1 type III secretion system protein [Escherichia albertii]
MKIGFQQTVLQLQHTSSETISKHELLDKWRTDSPDNERAERNIIYDSIMNAECTGTLLIEGRNVTSIPVLPDNISELKLNRCIRLKSIPPLPDRLKVLSLRSCHELTLPPLPDGLQELSLLSCDKIESIDLLPSGLKNLSLMACSKLTSILYLPDGLESLTLDSCYELKSIPLLPYNLKTLSISENRDIKLSQFPRALESLTVDMHAYNKDSSFPALPYQLSSFSASYGKVVPSLPPQLSSLSLQHFSEIVCTTLPDSLEKLDLQSCPFSPLMEMLPGGLKELSITNLKTGPDTVIDHLLPKNLKNLSLCFCENIKLPAKLPASLSSISLSSMDTITWEIQPYELPNGIDIKIDGYVKLNPNILTRNDITFYDLPAGEASIFQPGDIVYGLNKERNRVITLVESIYNLSRKDIITQNTLTDAVWRGMDGPVFSKDEVIAERLNDVQRGISFRDFLLQHPRYNITDSKFSDLSNEDMWMKTSKAGLEFQTKLRDRRVIFLADCLIDTVSEIVAKKGKYGNAITAHELRWVYRNRNDDQVKNNVKFFLKGQAISHEDVFTKPGWEQYTPKNSLG